MTDKVYELLKKRLGEIFDLHAKAIDDPHRWPVRLDRLWLEYLEEIGCSVHHNYVRMSKSLPESEEFVFCHNPMRGRTPGGLERISVPKEIALKAIVLGEFPEFSLARFVE